MATVRYVSSFMRGNTGTTALDYSAKSIFEIHILFVKVALLSCEKTIAAAVVIFGGEWAEKGVT